MLTSHPVHAEDVARLEYALRASFEAGEAPPIAASELASASIALQPHVQLLALRTGADTLWRRCERGEHRGSLAHATAKASRFVAVYRQSHDLHVERLPRAAFEILSAVDETRSLDAAMDRVLAIPALLRRRDSERIQRWFAAWTAAGWFRRAGHDSAPSSDNRRCTSSMRTWLIGILRHKILDHFRWQQRHPGDQPIGDDADAGEPEPWFTRLGAWRSDPNHGLEALDADPAVAFERSELRAALQSCIDHVPKKLHHVFVLRDIDELAPDEAAAAGISHDSLAVFLYRARQALRACMQKTRIAT
jgi:RNA polymerase sigma-70 factor (ECF subfamily)